MRLNNTLAAAEGAAHGTSHFDGWRFPDHAEHSATDMLAVKTLLIPTRKRRVLNTYWLASTSTWIDRHRKIAQLKPQAVMPYKV